MTTIPPPLHTTAAAIDAYHEAQPDDWRAHLGASMLGHPCERWLWLSFRWAAKERFPGRIRRLFRRGHHEESWIVSDLRAIGCEIHSTDAEEGQNYISLAPHIGGSTDGIIERGVPEAPEKRHVLECKTHSKKSFDDLAKKGLEASKPMHYTQCQLYMLGTGIDRALYVAVCKDSDELYIERVRYDADHAAKYLERGKRLVASDRMPPPISTDPSWYQCRFCPAHSMCHSGEPTRHVNCRTCAHSTATDQGTWHCERWDADIPDDVQREGCDSHVLHPDLVPWRWVDGDGVSAVYEIEGRQVCNGDGGVKSRELIT